PWVRRCARIVVGSRGHGNQRQMRSRDPTMETGQPKLGNLRPGLVEFTPPTKKARPSAPGSLPPRIMRNARKGENAKPSVRGERQSTRSEEHTSELQSR